MGRREGNMSAKEQWVRVESEDELRPGMMVKYTRPADREHVAVITEVSRGACPMGCTKFRSTLVFDTGLGNCYRQAISAGLIYRLAVPPDEAALADEKEASRRAAKVKERTR